MDEPQALKDAWRYIWAQEPAKLSRADLAKKLGIPEAQLGYEERRKPKVLNRKQRRRNEQAQKRAAKKRRHGAHNT